MQVRIFARRLVILGLFLGGGCIMEMNETRPADVQLIRQYSETAGYTHGRPTGIRATEDGTAVLFLRSGPRDNLRKLFEMDVASGDVRELIRAEEILGDADEKLSAEEKARRERMREGGRGIASFDLSADGRHILITLGGGLHVIRRSDRRITSLPKRDEGPAIDSKFSPNGKYVTCVRGHDLYAIDWEAGEEWAVTTGGSAAVTHALAEFVAAEEMGRHTGYWWSGDSKLLAFAEADLREVEVLRIADSFHPEKAPQPWRYPRAGTANAKVRLGIVSVRGGKVTWVDWDRERFPYLATVKWGRSGPLTILVQARDQQEQVLYRVDPTNGQLTELLRETDQAWLNIHRDMPRWFSEGSRFIWLSESRGSNSLELRDRDGELQRTLTFSGVGTGEHARIDGVVAVNEEHGGIMVRHGDRPTEVALSAVKIDTGAEMPWSSRVDPRPGKSSNAVWSGTASKNWMTWVLTKSDQTGARTSWVVSKLSEDGVVHELPSIAVQPPYVPTLELTTVEGDGRVFQTA
ncbi:MAG: DPP IV N-terminal domain-containing protein, partial [Planctomycetota bacterium]|nr:DPP IV N-terminal domain-containing protein [Planctomycetota bacterium]